jgi:hypothetical protein
MKKVGTWIVAVAVIAITVLMVIYKPSVQEQQRACEKRCAPRMGVWKRDPNFPAAPEGKIVPMVCVCQ